MLTIRQFQDLCRQRSAEAFDMPVGDVPVSDWAMYVIEEVGELTTLITKSMRGKWKWQDKRQELLSELADVITYSILMISALDADAEDVIVEKFNEVSARQGWPKLEL